MDLRYLAYVGADPDFYDDVWQVSSEDQDDLGPVGVARNVTVRDSGPWRVYQTPRTLPSTGWKVHVSCVPARAAHVVRVAVDAALDQGLSCKHLRTSRLVASSQAKYADPVGAGKVVTVYPTNEADLSRIVCRLTDLLAGEPGARVLSDIPVDGAPVSLRYGAFMGMHHLDDSGQCGVGLVGDDGSSAVDDRSAHSGGRAQQEAPSFVRDLQDAATRRDASAVLPVRDVRVIHRSNAGGVYAATWVNGAPVVLKEARRHTGFDLAGSDAVTRLRHERRALERLAGTGVVPEFVDYREVGDSEFLVMEFAEGASTTTGMATRHPGAVPEAEGATYRQWVEDIVEGTRQALHVLHSRGVSHLDVHPGNVIEREGQVILIDLESSSIDGVAVARGVGTVLSTCVDDLTPEADLVALLRMRALLLNPQFSLTAHRPELAVELVAAGEADLHDLSVFPESPDDNEDRAVSRIVAGLHVAANPARADRLFPGDVAGLGVPGGGLGLLHGAGGVLQALTATGRLAPEGWRAWLVDNAKSAPYLTPGLGYGAEGIALCLARIGETSAAREVIQRWGHRVSPAPWWTRGTAGQAVAQAELSLELNDPDLMMSALNLVGDTLAALEHETPLPGYRAGLLDGWAGVGLALLRIAECLTATQSDAHGTQDRLTEAARRAFDLEMASVRIVGGAWMTTDGNRLMPYLGTGSTALGILAHALINANLEARPEVDTTILHDAVEGVLRALRLRSIACSGLLHGRAGLLLALGCLAPEEPIVNLHRHRLGWHTVPVATTSRHGHPLASRADFLLGDQNMRSSADLATGAAGILLAASGDSHLGWSRAVNCSVFPV